MNTRASLLAIVSHHIIHDLTTFWIQGLSCTIRFRRIFEKEYGRARCIRAHIYKYQSSQKSKSVLFIEEKTPSATYLYIL